MRNTIIILGFLITSIVSYGQSVSGPTSVTGGGEYVYTFTTPKAGLDPVGTTCAVSVKEGVSRSGGAILLPAGKTSVTFKVKWNNVTGVGEVKVQAADPYATFLNSAKLGNIKITKDNTCYTTAVSGQNITSAKTYTGCNIEVTNTTVSNNATVTITADKYVSIKPSFTATKGTYVSIKSTNSSTLKSSTALPDNIDVLVDDKPSLDQNYPNPFTSISTITFSIPEKSKNAYLQIFDLGGRTIDKIKIIEKGEGSVILNSSKFNSNVIYLYCLVIDDITVDTKKFYVK